MKLTTIWTIPAMALGERLRRTWDEWFLRGVAHRLPRRLAYWSFIDTGAWYSTQVRPNVIVPEMLYMDILEAFGKKVGDAVHPDDPELKITVLPGDSDV